VNKATPTQPQYRDAALPVTARVQDLLEQMTLEEKLAQLTSYWFNDLQENQTPSIGKMRALLRDGIG